MMMLPWMKVLQAEPLRLASRSSTSLIRHSISIPLSEIAFHGVYATPPGVKKSHFMACIPPHGLEARNRASRRIPPHANDQLSCMIVGVVGPPVCCPRNPRVARLPAGRHASCSLPSHPHPHKVEPLHTRVIFTVSLESARLKEFSC